MQFETAVEIPVDEQIRCVNRVIDDYKDVLDTSEPGDENVAEDTIVREVTILIAVRETLKRIKTCATPVEIQRRPTASENHAANV